jgi:hypothetical protein
MVVIGGLGSLPGVILGAVAVWSAQYFLPNGYALLANGLGIVLLLIFLPEGIGGLLYNGRDRLLRVVARRRHISTPGIWRAPDDADTTAAPGTRITAPGTPPAIPGTAGAPATTPATAAAPTPEPDSPAVAGTPHG